MLVSVLAFNVGQWFRSNNLRENPFVIGQTVYPTEAYLDELTSREVGYRSLGYEEFALREAALQEVIGEGGVVMDMTAHLIRIRFSDGSESDFDWGWFEAKEGLVLTDDWVLGNPFSVGQTVCAIPDSIRLDFPDRGVVEAISGNLLKLRGYGSTYSDYIHFGHFQECR